MIFGKVTWTQLNPFTAKALHLYVYCSLHLLLFKMTWSDLPIRSKVNKWWKKWKKNLIKPSDKLSITHVRYINSSGYTKFEVMYIILLLFSILHLSSLSFSINLILNFVTKISLLRCFTYCSCTLTEVYKHSAAVTLFTASNALK